MRTTASLAAFVTFMAVANSNAAPTGIPNGPSARSISRARGQIRSRDVPPMPNFRDVSFTVGVPDVKCGDCREGEAKKVSMDVTGAMANMEGGLKDTKNKVFSNDVQAPDVPSGSGSVHIGVNDDDEEGPDSGTSTQPQKQANDSPDANDGANTNDGGQTDDGRTDGGKTDAGQAEGGGKVDPPAEQSSCGCIENGVEDMRDEVKDDSKTVEDKAHEAMTKVEGKSDQVGDGVQAASSSMNEGVHEFSGEMKNKVADVSQMAGDMSEPDADIHAAVKTDTENRQDDAGKSFKMPKGDGTMPKIVTVGQESSSENTDGKDCEDGITIEMQQGNPSVSTSVLRR